MAGIKKGKRYLHPHNFRSNFITRKHDDGEDLLIIQALAGHASPQTTKLYTRISPERLKKVKPMPDVK